MTTPAPGSRIDRAINAIEQELPHAGHVATWQAEQPTPSNMTPVPVAIQRTANSDTAVYRTLVLNANSTQLGSYAQLLPQDPQRLRALVLAVDNDVILCDNKELAQSPNNFVSTPPNPQGFYLPKGTVVILESKGLVWAVNTSSSAATRVSVVIERYFVDEA